jgi:hypothetical protein
MKKVLLLVGVLLLLVSACAPRAAIQSQPALVEDTLYFGLDKPQGRVSEADWNQFLSEEVTPRFPDGLTVWDAKGQWKDPKGKMSKELTKVLLLVHPDNAVEDKAIQTVIEIYKKKFGQESVMKVRAAADVSF